MRAVCSILALGFVIAMATEGRAQQVSSFEQLQILVKPGDNIYVTDNTGKTIKGRLAELSSTSLGLTVDGMRQNLQQSNVREIRQWRGDSLRNGALIGAGVAGGLTTLALAFTCPSDGECGTGLVVAALAFYTAAGAGIGVGIDAMIPTKQTIFRNRVQGAFGKFQVKPVLNGGNKGVKVAFSF